ncbi:hypothetical protein STFR1_50345 [Bacillus vallismortis]
MVKIRETDYNDQLFNAFLHVITTLQYFYRIIFAIGVCL